MCRGHCASLLPAFLNSIASVTKITTAPQTFLPSIEHTITKLCRPTPSTAPQKTRHGVSIGTPITRFTAQSVPTRIIACIPVVSATCVTPAGYSAPAPGANAAPFIKHDTPCCDIYASMYNLLAFFFQRYQSVRPDFSHVGPNTNYRYNADQAVEELKCCQ
jgi:hypothetical protein